MTFNWKCPYCAHAQIVQNPQRDREVRRFRVEGHVGGDVGCESEAIVCANGDCRKLTFYAAVISVEQVSAHQWKHKKDGEVFFADQLVPRGEAKPQPDCVPSVLVEDYREACLIASLSPKASATLARRCLQGMIRDFCGIQKPTLVREIEALRALADAGSAPAGVTLEAIDAIDHVRHIGNIGAHMEKDINLIVPVDRGEAQALINLIEMLFDEWYVARDTRRRRLAEIAAIAGEKQAVIASSKQSAPPAPT